MTTVTVIAPELVPETRQSALESLLSDQEKVDAEFARIMTVSGFTGRVIVAVLTPPRRRRARRNHEAERVGRHVTVVQTPRRERRVRSPPQKALNVRTSPEPRWRAPGGTGQREQTAPSVATNSERSRWHMSMTLERPRTGGTGEEVRPRAAHSFRTQRPRASSTRSVMRRTAFVGIGNHVGRLRASYTTS